MSSTDLSSVMNLRKFRYQLLKNIRLGTTPACHLEEKKKEVSEKF